MVLVNCPNGDGGGSWVGELHCRLSRYSGPLSWHIIPSHRKVIHIILSQNTLCKRLFTHSIRGLLAPPNTICMCKRANFNMYRVVVSAYLYIFENSWPNRILFRKIPVSVKFVSAILGPEMAAPILWTPGKMRSFCRKNNVRKIPPF